jgi:Ca2+/H+ antiporter
VKRSLANLQANFETITLFVSVMLVNLLLQDGKSNYMEGLMCKSFYSSCLLVLTRSDVPVLGHRALLLCLVDLRSL